MDKTQFQWQTKIVRRKKNIWQGFLSIALVSVLRIFIITKNTSQVINGIKWSKKNQTCHICHVISYVVS